MNRLSTLVRGAGGVLLGALVVWGAGLLVQCAQPAQTRIVPDSPGDLSRAVIHYDPRAHNAVAATYHALMAALPPETELRVVVESQDHFERFAAAFHPPRSTRAVVIGKPVTTWSRDRYTLLERTDGTRVLLVPPQKTEIVPARAHDWLAPWRIAEAAGNIEIVETEFDFDGGDLIAHEDVVFADANLVRKNPDLFPNPAAVAQRLTALLGQPVVVLGATADDVPHHHIGMYLTPLPNGAVAVGSPALAFELLGPEGLERMAAELAQDGLPAIDFRPETAHRFDAPARQLEELGYRVVRLPLLPLDDHVTFVTFNNGVFHGDRFLMPAYGTSLDADAAQRLADEGLTVVPIPVRDIFRHHGSVRCLLNRL